MSEEILKALMQLFAIITKQDTGVSAVERNFVESFLKQQLARESVEEYLNLYESFSGYSENTGTESEDKKPKLTSMKDSVRTLAICKKINKTLTQKQKVVVLVRIIELVKSDNNFTPQRKELIETVSSVFNIEQAESELIYQFIEEEDVYQISSDKLLIIDSNRNDENEEVYKRLVFEGMDKPLSIIHIPSVDLYFVKYKGHSEINLNGLVFNTNSIYLLAPGSTIRLPLGTLYYSDVVSTFASNKEFVRIAFNAENLEFRFPNGHLALQNINISEDCGKLVALMGASGAGKTTLLNVLSGIETPSAGSVTINGIDIHKEPEKIEGIIGYIAQDDLLIEELTVFDNLYFNARLCFKDYTEEELVELVERTLNNLGLFEIKDIKVGSPLNKKISGGQRKRLNIALELIREPSVLFVDEPTSGLSSRDSENVMDLLKELSLKGKLIFVVIHQPSSDIFKMFDKLFLLDTGGLPIYYGNPIEAVIYFKKHTNQINAGIGECHFCGNVNPELLFNLVEAHVVDEYGNITSRRKVSPQEWHELFIRNHRLVKKEIKDGSLSSSFKIPKAYEQFKVFVKRDLLSKIANTQYLLVNLFEAPLLAFILSFIIRYIANPETGHYVYRENDNVAAYIFMCVIISLFIGLSVSAEEIFKDRKILKREAFLNLSRGSYLFSKLAILFSISALQTLMFVFIGNTVLGIKGLYLDYWLMLFSCSCLANVIGLNISVLFDSAVTIYILIPLLIIPQMVLGGAMFSFDKLNLFLGGGVGKSVPVIADFMASRWAFEGLAVHQFKNNEYEKMFYNYDHKESICNYKQAYYIPKLSEKLERSRQNILNNNKEQLSGDLLLLRNEIASELKRVPSLQFEYIAELTPERISPKVLDETEVFLENLKQFYSDAYNIVNQKKQDVLSDYIKTHGKEAFRNLYDNYSNDNLKELVCKELTKTKIREDDGRLIQVLDPVFMSTSGNSFLDVRSHFFAPEKKFAGQMISTYVFNIVVIWGMAVFLFLVLYFDLLNKLIKKIKGFSIKK